MAGLNKITEAVTETYTDSQRLALGNQLGELRADLNGNIYEFVKVVDLDLVVGDVVYPAAVTGTSVTSDYTGGSGLTIRVKGVAIAAVDISAAPYCWIQRAGVVSTLGDGSVAAGDPVIGHTTNGAADTMAAGEEHLVFGFALAADTGSPTVFACQLTGTL